ncbi:MAG: PDZ domain-containing protein [Gemmatimonadetes bacterium]|nr:PDZ domain-containing protein [Gemmatimonadota bacterium]
MVVTPGSNAARAGLMPGDTIMAVNGRDTRTSRMFPDRQPGTRYTMRIRRAGEDPELTYVMPAAPAPAGARPPSGS